MPLRGVIAKNVFHSQPYALGAGENLALELLESFQLVGRVSPFG
jgi:hypothetical protein